MQTLLSTLLLVLLVTKLVDSSNTRMRTYDLVTFPWLYSDDDGPIAVVTLNADNTITGGGATGPGRWSLDQTGILTLQTSNKLPIVSFQIAVKDWYTKFRL